MGEYDDLPNFKFDPPQRKVKYPKRTAAGIKARLKSDKVVRDNSINRPKWKHQLSALKGRKKWT